MKRKAKIRNSNYAAQHDALRRKFIFFGPYPFMGPDKKRGGRPKLYGDNQRLR